MKTNNYAIFLLITLFSMQSILAKQKDLIFVKNEYGQDIYVNVEYRKKKGIQLHSNNSFLILKNETKAIVADDFNHQFFKIYTCPATASISTQIGAVGFGVGTGAGYMTGMYAAQAGAAVGGATAAAAPLVAAGGAALAVGIGISEILKSLNNASHKAHGNTFFVVKRGSKESKVAGQKQIILNGYPSEQEYKNSMIKSVENRSDLDLQNAIA